MAALGALGLGLGCLAEPQVGMAEGEVSASLGDAHAGHPDGGEGVSDASSTGDAVAGDLVADGQADGVSDDGVSDDGALCGIPHFMDWLWTFDGRGPFFQWYLFRSDGRMLYRAQVDVARVARCHDVSWTSRCVGEGQAEVFLASCDGRSTYLEMVYQDGALWLDPLKLVDLGPVDDERAAALCAAVDTSCDAGWLF